MKNKEKLKKSETNLMISNSKLTNWLTKKSIIVRSKKLLQKLVKNLYFKNLKRKK